MPRVYFPPPTTAGLIATTTNDDAAAGRLGEYGETKLASASAVSLTNNTGATVVSYAFQPGDYDVIGYVHYVGNAATTLGYCVASLSDTNNTYDISDSDRFNMSSGFGLTVFSGQSTFTVISPIRRFSLAAGATKYLVARAGFGVNTLSAYGTIRWRRVR